MSDPLFSVEDQVVLASGCSRGIGRALAQAFAQRGAKVILSSRDRATLEAAAAEMSGKHAVSIQPCDIAKQEQISDLVTTVAKEYGRIDTLLNVAGINFRKRVETYTAEEYDQIVNTNLRGTFLLCQAVGREMIKRKAGAIVNIDSLNTYAPLKGVTPYAISKAGVNMMTRAMATEWGEHGVRVNTIAPGFFPTDLSKQLWAQPQMRDWAQRNTPLGRLGELSDLVGAAIFLASPAAGFITGQVVRVDGGITAGINWPIEL